MWREEAKFFSTWPFFFFSVPPLKVKCFFGTGSIFFFFSICRVYSDIKFMHSFITRNHGEISKETKMVKMAKNMNQWTIAKELGMSISNISEILLKFQSNGSVLNQPNYGCLWKLQLRIIWRWIRTAKSTTNYDW